MAPVHRRSICRSMRRRSAPPDGAPIARRLAVHRRVLLDVLVKYVAREEAALDALDDLLNAGR